MNVGEAAVCAIQGIDTVSLQRYVLRLILTILNNGTPGQIVVLDCYDDFDVSELAFLLRQNLEPEEFALMLRRISYLQCAGLREARQRLCDLCELSGEKESGAEEEEGDGEPVAAVVVHQLNKRFLRDRIGGGVGVSGPASFALKQRYVALLVAAKAVAEATEASVWFTDEEHLGLMDLVVDKIVNVK